MASGLLINIEGAGGSGKTRAAKLLEGVLTALPGERVVRIDWLRQSVLGSFICAYFEDEKCALELKSLSWILMVQAARRQALEELIYPLAVQGIHVIVESFFEPLKVTFGSIHKFKEVLEALDDLDGAPELGFRPDMTIFTTSSSLDISRLKPYDEMSFPDPVDRFAPSKREQTLAAWNTHFIELQGKLKNQKSCSLHSLDMSLQDDELKQTLIDFWNFRKVKI